MSEKKDWNEKCPLYLIGEIKCCYELTCPDDYVRCIFYAGTLGAQNYEGLEEKIVEKFN